MTRLPAGGGRDHADAEAVLAAFARTDGDVAAARRVARRFADLDEGERSALLWSEDPERDWSRCCCSCRPFESDRTRS
ncbi:hypothetical protein P9139_05305 [Curtobacterium flaccumfaciens]|nr:hypothetical protein P9139_05305 [Curtobacterium flaccumfaciens]